jgi:hypothetical protein
MGLSAGCVCIWHTQATPFLEMFMRYGRSHMWFGAHLLILLVIALCLGLKASLLAAWSNVVAILSLLVAPFWFNPFSLDWQKNKVGLHARHRHACIVTWVRVNASTKCPARLLLLL